MSLLALRAVQLHSGRKSSFKIDCDALTDADIEAAAALLVKLLPPFGEVHGIPRGGERLEKALRPYISAGSFLIVDDVLTTGRSMEDRRRLVEATNIPYSGAVLFARGPCPSWITPLFTLHERLWEE